MTSLQERLEDFNSILFFRFHLLDWFAKAHRPLPWKKEKSPYYIWLSEIILQQTRVEQGLPYFLRFKEAFPDIQSLAEASEDEVLKLWQGLGYYSRARNLHFTAKYIANELNGVFPKTYNEVLNLKGIGPYTAAAVVSFAYGLPHAVVDGNVMRVLSRFFGITLAVDSKEGKKTIDVLAQKLLDKDAPGDYNQAIMDFGATVCTPKKAKCGVCPLSKKCYAFKEQKVYDLPLKEKKVKKRSRVFNYLVLKKGESTIIKKRLGKDIWQSLYDFPLIETNTIVSQAHLRENDEFQQILKETSFDLTDKSSVYRQVLSHQRIAAIFWELKVENFPNELAGLYEIIPYIHIKKYPFPKIIDCYLSDNSLNLELF